MTIDDLIEFFPGGRWHGDEYETRCPAHKDDKPSLGISRGRNGGVVMCCQAGCANRDILAKVGLDLKALAPPTTNGRQPWGEVVETYRYDREDGIHAYDVCRTTDKQFPVRRPDGKWGIGDEEWVLFGLPDLLKSRPGEVIAITEGEKDALNIRKRGVRATCNPGGASKGRSKWRQEYTDWLKTRLPDRKFVIFWDNDEAGHAHADAVRTSLATAGLEARIADTAGLGRGEDISDWLPRHSEEEFLALLRPPPPKLWPRLLSFRALLQQPSPSWLVEDFAFEETMLEIYGPPNEGKTFIAVDLCMSILQARKWCGRSVDRSGSILYVNADGGPGFADRGRAWTLINGMPEGVHEFWTLPEPVNLYREDAMNDLGDLIAYLPEPPIILVIDTYSRCIPGVNENQQEFASLVVDNLTRLMRQFHLSPWLLHHTDKTGKHDRGSSVILGACDTQVRVSQDRRTNVISLECEKQRDNALFEPVYFDLGRVPSTNETWVTWRPEPPAPHRQERTLQNQEAVLAVIAENPGIDRESLYLALEFAERTLMRHVSQLVRSGRVVEQPLEREEGRRGKARQGLFALGEARGMN